MAESERDFSATSEAMDAAASAAEQELKNLDSKAVIIVATWWRNNYLKAGHKRLGRILKNFKV